MYTYVKPQSIDEQCLLTLKAVVINRYISHTNKWQLSETLVAKNGWMDEQWLRWQCRKWNLQCSEMNRHHRLICYLTLHTTYTQYTTHHNTQHRKRIPTPLSAMEWWTNIARHAYLQLTAGDYRRWKIEKEWKQQCHEPSEHTCYNTTGSYNTLSLTLQASKTNRQLSQWGSTRKLTACKWQQWSLRFPLHGHYINQKHAVK